MAAPQHRGVEEAFVTNVYRPIQMLIDGDLRLTLICLENKEMADASIVELVVHLIQYPNRVKVLRLSKNGLSDVAGVALAHYIATSSTIQELNIKNNRFGAVTYRAMAAALRTNTSLCYLYMYGNKEVDTAKIDASFLAALHANPKRYICSFWVLYGSGYVADYPRLMRIVMRLPAPSMLNQLRRRPELRHLALCRALE